MSRPAVQLTQLLLLVLLMTSATTSSIPGQPVEGAATTTSTCLQCNQEGYSYFCAADAACYSTEVTCSWECSNSSTCVSTAQCETPMSCTADQQDECGDGYTCCIDQNGNPFCAPGDDLVCCNYNGLTCSQGLVCDPAGGGCVVNNNISTAECTACENMVSSIESNGCSDACNFLPLPFNEVCSFAMSNTDLCQTITNFIEGGLTPWAVCTTIPFVSLCATNVTCDCGYCQPGAYGSWCLSLPNTCPTTASKGEHDRSFVARNSSLHGRDLCVDGVCSADTAGCCLTCAP